MKRYEIWVQDLMPAALLTVNASATIAEAQIEMAVEVVRQRVGLVTQTDFLELARRARLGLPLERVTEAS